jgi:hypothetical protein
MNRRGFLTLLAGLAAAAVVLPDEASANVSAPVTPPKAPDPATLADKLDETSSEFTQYRRRRYARRRVYRRRFVRRPVYRRRYARRVYRPRVYRRVYARRRYRPVRVRFF